MGYRTLIIRVGVGALSCGLLLYLAWYVGQPLPVGQPDVGKSIPAPVQFPRQLPGQLVELAREQDFTRVVVRGCGPQSGTLDFPCDLVVTVKADQRVAVQFPGSAAASGENLPRPFILVWTGQRSARNRAMVVRCLEIVLRCFGLERKHVWSAEEFSVGEQDFEQTGMAEKGADFSGRVLRSWIRGVGAGQENR